jgi:hypothetical protein
MGRFNLLGINQYPDELLHESLDSFALPDGPPAFRGPYREPFSESWMCEMRLSSSISGKRKQNQVKPD